MKLENLFNAVTEASRHLYLNIGTYSNCVWMYSLEDEELVINTDANKEQMFDGEGFTYCFYAKHYEASEDGYVCFQNVDNGCGETFTILLKKSEQVDCE